MSAAMMQCRINLVGSPSELAWVTVLANCGWWAGMDSLGTDMRGGELSDFILGEVKPQAIADAMP